MVSQVHVIRCVWKTPFHKSGHFSNIMSKMIKHYANVIEDIRKKSIPPGGD